jgi:DNA invertase Pin-like site-specific DNA recombinase
MLKAQGIEIIAADRPGAFVKDAPTAALVRQVLGAVAQFDKAMTVAKLRLARDRVRKHGKFEGRKSHAEERPEAADLVRWGIGRSASGKTHLAMAAGPAAAPPVG